MSIAPTLTLSEAAERVWDVAVIGAGPAGTVAAYQLARRGGTVLLLDKASFPRYKVCGSCLNVRALATLSAVGLGELTTRHGAKPLEEFRLAVRGCQVSLPLPGGVALSRATLDAALVRAAVQAGAAFVPETLVALGPVTGDLRYVTLHRRDRQTEIAARVVLVANGLGSRLLTGEPDFKVRIASGSRIGAGVTAEDFPPFYHAGTIFMACSPGGYVGLVQLEDGRLDIGAALDPALVKRAGGLGRAAAKVLAEAGYPPLPGMASLAWRGTPPLTCRLNRFAAERTFVLGDAAGYVEPFTGEGIAWAAAAGAAVAPLAHRAACRWDPTLITRWAVRYRQVVVRRQRACRVVAQALRHPRLIRTAIGILSRMPILAVPLIRYLHG